MLCLGEGCATRPGHLSGDSPVGAPLRWPRGRTQPKKIRPDSTPNTCMCNSAFQPAESRELRLPVCLHARYEHAETSDLALAVRRLSMRFMWRTTPRCCLHDPCDFLAPVRLRLEIFRRHPDRAGYRQTRQQEDDFVWVPCR